MSVLSRIEYTVPVEMAGQRLDTILRRELNFSGTEMKRLKRCESIYLNGTPSHVNVPVQTGDKVSVLLEEDERSSLTVEPVPGELDILYEDEYLLLINKPPFVPVHTTGGHMDDSLANFVVYYYQQKGLPGMFRAVHRLDRNTSGVVLIAKSAYVNNILREQREQGILTHSYIAVVHGQMPESGQIEGPILRPLAATIRREVHPDGDYALTCYEKIDGNEQFSLLKVQPRTGRTHQIRVHMSHIGHPLAGDFLYGNEEPELINRHALHCSKLKFVHPVTRIPQCIDAPLPDDMRALCVKTGLSMDTL